MKLITENFKTHAATQFHESFSEAANTIYYMAAHRSIPFSDDNNPPDPDNSLNETHYKLYDEMLFGKHITPADVKLMIKNDPWVTGTVYDMYDDKDSTLSAKTFFIVSPESGNYHIFKCLYNAGGEPSTDQPLFSETDAADTLYITSDGYQWKYMFTVTNAEFGKFATVNFIPVIPNANVTANSVSGTIETILVSTVGDSYNSYAECVVKESAVAGNTLLYSLLGERNTDYLLTLDTTVGLVEEKITSINLDAKEASGVIVAIFPANNTIQVTNTLRAFDATVSLTGASSNTTANILSADRLTTALSANTDFYKNNSMYIRYGTGAGQLRTITEYIVTGGERRVLVNAEFNPLPDTSSIIEIGPRVILSGDGAGANAVATVDPSTNSIFEIEIIDRGIDYSFADVTIVGNSGILDDASNPILTTGANARVIIAPHNGHGSDVAKELFAKRVGVAMEFANTEVGLIPAVNDYRKFSIVREPMFANVELTLETSFTATSFTAGETITQPDTGATALISNRSGVTLRLTDIRGFFQTGNSSINEVVGDTSGYLAAVTGIDKSVETFDQRETYQVNILDSGPLGGGFNLDELVIQPGIDAISSDIVKLLTTESAYIYNDGETITQVSSGASGIITDRFDNLLTLNNIVGTFIIGNIVGSATSVSATVINIDNTIAAAAVGYVHEISANADVISLTNVRGFFGISDDVSGSVKVFNGNDTQAVAKITGRDYSKNALVDNSGDIIYVENMTPISRSATQTEKIKVIIEF
ncbi:MAG: hypothetical protein COA84_13165 [Robiginitomaculum sp.]|nr:MAG: hypothetical protein COA84_13165 [Robiginitomaculum sp.]